MSCRRSGEKRGAVPSYHAASMGPLIFAALRFCLALSTLHTSTADRRHKTLYRESLPERGSGRGERGKESRENRSDGCARSIVYRRAQRMRAYAKSRNDICFFDGIVQRKYDKASRVTGISTGNQTVYVMYRDPLWQSCVRDNYNRVTIAVSGCNELKACCYRSDDNTIHLIINCIFILHFVFIYMPRVRVALYLISNSYFRSV